MYVELSPVSSELAADWWCVGVLSQMLAQQARCLSAYLSVYLSSVNVNQSVLFMCV